VTSRSHQRLKVSYGIAIQVGDIEGQLDGRVEGSASVGVKETRWLERVGMSEETSPVVPAATESRNAANTECPPAGFLGPKLKSPSRWKNVLHTKATTL
jgi:hypothetical protein